MVESLVIGGVSVGLGERRRIALAASRLYDATPVYMPVNVLRGSVGGPVLFVSAAIHGDEINGVEIVRRLMKHRALEDLRGTLIAVPIVNMFGFNAKSRYLPDRRDLNRCFPGAADGSMGAQLAHLFMTEIVARSTHGIDLHTGAFHRSNLPHVRADLDDPVTRELAECFGTEVIVHSKVVDGSLREAAARHGLPVLLFEGGESLRFDEGVIRRGVKGILAVMRAIGMLERVKEPKTTPPFVARSSAWVRAPQSGLFIARRELGDRVNKGEKLGVMTDPFGREEIPVLAGTPGVIIGQSKLPLANEGEALFHVASMRALKRGQKPDMVSLSGDPAMGGSL